KKALGAQLEVPPTATNNRIRDSPLLRTNSVYFEDSAGSGQSLRHHAGTRRDHAVKLRTEVAMLKLIEEHPPELDDLCRRHHVSPREVFGSAASGEVDAEASDLDCLVEFKPLAPGDRADAYFGSLHGLEDLFARRSTSSRFRPFAILGFGAPAIGCEKTVSLHPFGLP